MSKLQRPTVPALEYVFSIYAHIGSVQSSGLSPKGERLHIEITGGVVEGPRLQGRVISGGSDWPLIRADGTSEITARYSIAAKDGTPIMVRNDGLRVSSPEVTERLRDGRPTDPSEYYFRTAPIFEAPIGSHDWLNNSLFVASLARTTEGVAIEVYRLT